MPPRLHRMAYGRMTVLCGKGRTMRNYLIMCRSLTYAQRSVRTLERAGITATVTKAPQSTGGLGCTYSVKVSERVLADALRYLENSGLTTGKVYMLDGSGEAREVSR